MVNRIPYEYPPELDFHFREFRESQRMHDLAEWLRKQAVLFGAHIETDESIDFLDSDHVLGFGIRNELLKYDHMQFHCIARWFADNVHGSGYIRYMSDSFEEKNNPGIQTYRHYLKPRMKVDENNKLDLLFGNISIELLFMHERPHLIKLIAKPYPGRNYIHNNSMQSLIETITLT